MPELYGAFDQDGYRIEAYIPSGSKELSQWTIRILKDTKLVQEAFEPMNYEPLFGVDVEDIAALNERVDKLLSELTNE